MTKKYDANVGISKTILLDICYLGVKSFFIFNEVTKIQFLIYKTPTGQLIKPITLSVFVTLQKASLVQSLTSSQVEI